MKNWLSKNISIVELLGGYAVLDAVNFLIFPQDLGYRNFILSPYWLIILLMSSRYGFGAGLTSGVLAFGHFLYFRFSAWPTFNQIEQLTETQEMIIPISFVVIGMMLGNVRQKFIWGEKQKTDLIQVRDKDIKSKNERLEYLERSRRILEARIVGQTTTIETLYDSARHLETMEFDEVYRGCLDILAKHCQVQKASVYIKEGDFFVLKAAYGWPEGKIVEGKVHSQNSLMARVFKENKTVTVKDLLKIEKSAEYSTDVLAMFPLRSETGVVLGVVNIEKMEFLSFNKSTLQIIELVMDWVSQALHRIAFLKSFKTRLIFDEEYQIYNYSHFKSVLEHEFVRAKKFKLKYTVSLVKLDQFGFFKDSTQKILSKTVISLLKKYLSPTDMIFQYRIEGMLGIISPMQTVKDLDAVWNSVKKELGKIKIEKEFFDVSPKILISSQEFRNEMDDPTLMLAPILKECGVAN